MHAQLHKFIIHTYTYMQPHTQKSTAQKTDAQSCCNFYAVGYFVKLLPTPIP